MVLTKEQIEKIKEIVEKHHKSLTISLLGKGVFTQKQLKQMKELGVDTDKKDNLLHLIYHHNMLNEPDKETNPTSVEDMQAQQAQKVPQGDAHDHSREHLEETFLDLANKQQQNVISRILGEVRDNNMDYLNNALQNLDRPDGEDDLVKEATVSKLKQILRDNSKDASRDWKRVVSTELSNAIGMGSAQRIVADNRDKDISDVYVYRIVVNDAKLCKHCRRFYLDNDGSPKVYKMSTLLANGSNYGKKTVDWKPTYLATHPSERCSALIELRPGFKVLPGGEVTFIGLEKWKDYIVNKIEG